MPFIGYKIKFKNKIKKHKYSSQNVNNVLHAVNVFNF